MKELLDKNVGQIVAEDYRSALVFRKYNIELCCNGNRNLGEICKQEDRNQDEIVIEIDVLRNIGNQEVTNYNLW